MAAARPPLASPSPAAPASLGAKELGTRVDGGSAEKRKPARREAVQPALAVLDLGTNNCRLLIARPAGPERFRAVDSFSRIGRLGGGGATTGMITDAAM